jgi:Transcriptional Coactivator p15 (PC4)
MSRPTLVQPIEVAKFFKNRRKDVIVVSLSTYEGTNLVDVRQHFTNDQGQNRPTQKGIALAVLRLPDLAKAVNKALAKAKELGLLDDESEAGE